MEHEKRAMGFEEADRRYDELKRRYEAGAVNAAEFDARLKELMVRDDEDRWWVRSRKTGRWMYHDGDTWVPGAPPGYPGAPSAEAAGDGILGKIVGVVAFVVAFALAFVACQALV